jgi:glycine betaine/choline ABC-type transport system substrate-binding protein
MPSPYRKNWRLSIHCRKVSDLQKVAGQLVFGAEHEFFTQEGSMKFGPFTKFYGLKFKDTKAVDVSLKYAGIMNGSFEVTEVYATDGLNRKAKLKVLQDDRKFFPEYNGAFLVREDIFTRFAAAAPDLEQVLNLLAGQIKNEDMVEMTYQVDVQGRPWIRWPGNFYQEAAYCGLNDSGWSEKSY